MVWWCYEHGGFVNATLVAVKQNVLWIVQTNINFINFTTNWICKIKKISMGTIV